MQSPAAEAVLRHVIEKCPHRSAVKALVIMLAPGGQIGPADTAFERRFEDTGLMIVPHNRVVAGKAHGETRLFDSQTNLPVLQVLLREISPPKDGVQEAIVSWAWLDDAGQQRYRLAPKPAGGFAITELEEIPIPGRTGETKSTQAVTPDTKNKVP